MNDMDNKYFIEKVHLGGYKSIQNTSVDFLPGLNIVIGKNGTGKTNFFEFLNKSMNLEFSPRIGVFFQAVLEYEGEKLTYKYEVEEVKKNGNHRSEKILNVKGEINYNDSIYSVNKNIIQKDKEEIDISELEGELYTEKDIKLSDITYIKYGHPLELKESLLFLSKELKVAFIENKAGEMSNKLFLDFIIKYNKNIDKMREYVPELAEHMSLFWKDDFNILIKYSPIQEIRINKGITIDALFEEIDKGFAFGNIFLDYKYNNQWFTFDELSDGTQRVLYIIHKIIRGLPPIILLEEPELGIHPHQFHLLMDFLKEASETKQIIISTHSPQALNVLNMNELDRILVADMTEEGTQFHHLSEKTKAKARKYMENEDSLGAFWLHSDLEK